MAGIQAAGAGEPLDGWSSDIGEKGVEMQHDIGTVAEWRKRKVIDRDGDKIGRFEAIYLSRGSQRPEWAAVSTGLFGLKHSIVPLHDAQEVGDEIQVPLEAAQVKDAPRIDPDGELSPEEEERLHSHYGLGRTGAGSRAGGGDAGDGEASAGSAVQGQEASAQGEGVGASQEGREGVAHDREGAPHEHEEGDRAREPRSALEGGGVGGENADRHSDPAREDHEDGGRTRRHVVTEEVHRSVRTEEVDPGS